VTGVYSAVMRSWLLVCSLLLGCNQILGLDETRLAIDGPPGAGCCVADPSCGGFTDDSACRAASCVWYEDPFCGGSAQPCAGQAEGTCGVQVGCQWEGSGCGGTHAACSTFDVTRCTDHRCAWSTCGGTHHPCATYGGGTQLACTSHGCTYTGPSCSGNHAPCSSFTTMDDCERHECTWGGIVYDAGTDTLCSGTPHGCSAHDGGPAACSAVGCTNNPATCGGTPHPCCGMDPLTCATQAGNHGCSDLPTAACCGQPHGCADHDGAAGCDESGCTWQAGCAGTAAECSGLTMDTCGTQAGCAWQADGGCGAPTDCGGRGAAACTAGCTWRTDC
jgi:hypothetical protein